MANYKSDMPIHSNYTDPTNSIKLDRKIFPNLFQELQILLFLSKIINL
jgi:hypothetical protein